MEKIGIIIYNYNLRTLSRKQQFLFPTVGGTSRH